MKFRTVLATLAILATMFLAACTPSYRQAFEDAGKEKHWTKKQVLAAFAYYDRVGWAREIQEGSNQYVIIYGKVPTAKVASRIEIVLKDLDMSLDPNDKKMRQYLDTFKLRADLEREEEITKAQYARVHAADLENQFEEKMGDSPSSGPEAEMARGYNLKKIFVSKDLSQAFPFTSSQIEGAKKDGSLKEIESLELDFSSVYDHKAVDPSHPTDQNEFVWKPSKLSIRLTNYKIVTEDKPQDNKGNYIEGYRVIDGKQESKPALKIFFPAGGEGAVVLIDTNREGQDPSFGIPDILETVYDLRNVRDVINNGTLLATLFQEKKSERRVIPPHNLFKIEIARVDQPIDPWEKSPEADGWIVPFKYVAQSGDNYNVRIKFRKPKFTGDMTAAEAHAHGEYMEIEYVAKEYTKAGDRYTASPGQVIEYYRPKGEFAKKLQAKVLDSAAAWGENVKKLSFEFENGDEVNGLLPKGSNKFIEDKPYAISYTEGAKRWWIESSANDSKFDKRRQVSPPKDRTGVYSDDLNEDRVQQESSNEEMSGMDMKGKNPKQ